MEWMRPASASRPSAYWPRSDTNRLTSPATAAGAWRAPMACTRVRSSDAARFMYCSTREPCALGSRAAMRSLLAFMSWRHSTFTRATSWERVNTGPVAPPPLLHDTSTAATNDAAAARRTPGPSHPRQMQARYPRPVLTDYASYESGIGLDWYALDPNLRALLDRLLPEPDDRAFAQGHVAEDGARCRGPLAPRPQ